jgi:hypothetical protein
VEGAKSRVDDVSTFQPFDFVRPVDDLVGTLAG